MIIINIKTNICKSTSITVYIGNYIKYTLENGILKIIAVTRCLLLLRTVALFLSAKPCTIKLNKSYCTN